MSDESNEEKGTEREEKRENTKPILRIKRWWLQNLQAEPAFVIRIFDNVDENN